MPTGRALFLLRSLVNGEGSGGSGGGEQVVRAALEGAGLARSASLTADSFVALFLASPDLRAQSNTLVILGCAETLGVAFAPPEALEALGSLYDRLVASRAAGGAFSAAALCEVSRDAGFIADEADAAAFLTDCGAAAAAAAAPGAAAAAVPSPPQLLSREHFVDFLAAGALAAGVPAASISDSVRTYALLHLSGIREAAGVAPSGRA